MGDAARRVGIHVRGKAAQRHFTKVYSKERCRTTGHKPRSNFAALVYSCLQKMGSAVRRKAIQNCMQQAHRLALEKFMVSSKAPGQDDVSLKRKGSQQRLAGSAPALCDVEPKAEAANTRGHSGICRSRAACRLYGYYAKSGIDNLCFWGQIHRELADAVRDHIVLSKILEQIRFADTEKAFSSRVQEAVKIVLSEEGLGPGFLRTVTVRFSAQHWLGRGLSIHFSSLDRALDAHHRLQEARSVPLFKGGANSSAYTPEEAQAQWQCLRRTYVQLQAQAGRRNGQRIRRCDVEARLASLESAYHSTFVRKAARFRQLQEKMRNAKAKDPEEALLLRLQRLLKAWDRADLAEKRRLRLERDRHERLTKKRRREDGKGSLHELLQRRVQARAGGS